MSSVTIKEQISQDLKEAMKAREQVKVDTLRSALSAMKYKENEVGKEKVLSNEEELAVIQKQVKQRNDSIAEFTKAGRQELADKEILERDILIKYLPAQKSPDEIKAIVQGIIDGLPVEGRNAGAVMKAVMPKVKGLADGNVVKQIVSDLLGQ
jgi:uncharacterized protein YqeY